MDRSKLDAITTAVLDFQDEPVDPGEAQGTALILRAANARLWRQIRSVEAMLKIERSDVEAELKDVGFRVLFEAGVLRVDPQAWWKWRNQ